MAERTCALPNCEKKPRSGRQPLCNMHYQRQWKQDQRCSLDGCERAYLAKGMCGMHYKRTADGRDLNAPSPAAPGTPCDIDGCERRRHAGGLCAVHYQRQARTGDPLGFLSVQRPDICSVPGCAGAHFGLGLCTGHYKRQHRGAALVSAPCHRCGAAYVRPLGKDGSYRYCSSCMTDPTAGRVFWAMLRRERRAANNRDLTDEDRALALDYREVIATDPCVYCGQSSTAVDHIVPVLHGGQDRWENYAPVCTPCNTRKRARSVLDTLIYLGARRADRAPRREAA